MHENGGCNQLLSTLLAVQVTSFECGFVKFKPGIYALWINADQRLPYINLGVSSSTVSINPIVSLESSELKLREELSSSYPNPDVPSLRTD